MEQKLIKLLDNSLECKDCKIKEDKVIIKIYSARQSVICPYCGRDSARVHSVVKHTKNVL